MRDGVFGVFGVFGMTKDFAENSIEKPDKLNQ
jgi:hypothetical protein